MVCCSDFAVGKDGLRGLLGAICCDGSDGGLEGAVFRGRASTAFRLGFFVSTRGDCASLSVSVDFVFIAS